MNDNKGLGKDKANAVSLVREGNAFVATWSLLRDSRPTTSTNHFFDQNAQSPLVTTLTAN